MKKSTIARHLAQLGRRPDAGMSTAEYAVGTIAACAFAALLLMVIKSGAVEGLVTTVITTALSVSL
ncbi:DUF4244 domain-containing protein [Ornithinimicrobium pekingense]|uniref:DUF4244 domain-containing protein n=1 Tax=Ornithinimicrobium pekingense TaxID=384677 RepID=A0ABQ2F4J5_9MICO|nr:DUF4244 domain-containing protein [Ornithinimicrobium pekingense]GGK57822.1 hypothetical protein GCM10011509_02800 [Ornithinimicrobium pekingense]